MIPQRSIIDQLIGQLSFAGFGDFDISQSQQFRNAGSTLLELDLAGAQLRDYAAAESILDVDVALSSICD